MRAGAWLAALALFLGCPQPEGDDDAASDDDTTGDDDATGDDDSGDDDTIPPFEFVPSTDPGVLNWDQFPEFQLPGDTIAVWQSVHFGSLAREPLDHGFTHLAQSGAPGDALWDLPPAQRAILWTGVAYAPDQPWGDLHSPWGNDVATFETRWAGYMGAYADLFADTAGGALPDVDLMCPDIESHLTSEADILALRGDPSTPPEVAALPDAELVDRYRRDMATLYDAPLAWALDQGLTASLTSYSDVPIRRTWWDITSHDWTAWTTDWDRVSYLVCDPAVPDASWQQNLGPFYEHQTLLTPSAYLFYAYPATPEDDPNAWNSAADSLAYALFQVEANAAWSDKDLVLYLWMTHHPCCGSANVPLAPQQAHALAIFPFLAGARGVWLWDDDHAGDPAKHYDHYEWFVYGLYRLSEHAAFLDGTATPYAETDTPALMSGNLPVWRGLVQGDEMLVAAQNPYAADGEPTEVPVTYLGTPLGTVSLQGREVALEVLAIPRGARGSDGR